MQLKGTQIHVAEGVGRAFSCSAQLGFELLVFLVFYFSVCQDCMALQSLVMMLRSLSFLRYSNEFLKPLNVPYHRAIDCSTWRNLVSQGIAAFTPTKRGCQSDSMILSWISQTDLETQMQQIELLNYTFARHYEHYSLLSLG